MNLIKYFRFSGAKMKTKIIEFQNFMMRRKGLVILLAVMI